MKRKMGVSTSLAVFLKRIRGVMTGSGSWNIGLNRIRGVIRGRCISIDGTIRNHRLATGDSIRSGTSDPGRTIVKGGVISYGLFRPLLVMLILILCPQVPLHAIARPLFEQNLLRLGDDFLHSLPCIGFDCRPNLSLRTDRNRPITSGLSAPQPRRFSQSDLNSRHVRNK